MFIISSVFLLVPPLLTYICILNNALLKPPVMFLNQFKIESHRATSPGILFGVRKLQRHAQEIENDSTKRDTVSL